MTTPATSTTSTTSSASRVAAVHDGVLRGPRTTASRLRRGDLITGDPLALAGDRQNAWRLVQAPRGAWIVAQPITRDLACARIASRCAWRPTGPATAHRVPRGGVFVLPQESDEEGPDEGAPQW